MKRVLVLVLVLATFLTTLLPMTTFGKNQEILITIDGKTTRLTSSPINIEINGQRVEPDVPPLLIQDRTMVPVRFVSEHFGATVGWDGVEKKVYITYRGRRIILTIDSDEALIDGQVVKMDVPAKMVVYNGVSRTMIPLRFVSTMMGMEVAYNSTTRTAMVRSNNNDQVGTNSQRITSISYENGAVIVKADQKIDYNHFTLDNPDRIVVNIDNAILPNQQTIEAKDGIISGIRASQFEVNPNRVRIVVDLEKPTNYTITLEDNDRTMRISTGTAIVKNAGMVKRNNRDALVISTNGPVSFKTYPLTNENQVMNRIVVDVYNAEYPIVSRTVTVNKNDIHRIRIAQNQDSLVRTVLDINKPMNYVVEFNERDNEIIVYLGDQSKEEVSYQSIDLIGKVIVNSDRIKDNYKLSYDGQNNLILDILSKDVNINDQIIEIDDYLVSRVNVSRGSIGPRINIELKGPVKPENIVSSSVVGLALNLHPLPSGNLPPLIVIDPGHGAPDPGAVGRVLKLRESDIVMDISLRMERMLLEMGYRVYLTRRDDATLYIYDRAYIANHLNADIFVSVHNNASLSTSARGVEMYYYPSDSSAGNYRDNKTLAQYMQEEVVKALGAVNRGIKPTKDFVVTRETNMPAVLAEILFLSNEQDEKLLSLEDTREKAADAMVKAIVRYLQLNNK